jgi:MFS family permease
VRRDAGRPWLVAAVLLAVAATLILMFLPLVSVDTEPGGTSRQSLVEQEGWAIAAVLAVPVLVAAVPWLASARHRRWVTIGSAALLTAGVLVSLASVGMFYLPSAAALVVAAVRAPGRPQ